jgi:phage terminase large subunit GpA-like protein
MVAIGEACGQASLKRIVAVMGSQMGKTAGLLNVIGQRLHDNPAPLMYVGPTRNHIEKVIEPKVMELFRGVTTLWDTLDKGKKQSKTYKRVNGGSLRLAWAGSATELASDHALLVFVDEIDRMSDSAEGEGNVFELSEARTSTYADGRVMGVSTPTLGNVTTFVHPKTEIEHWAVSDTLASPIWRLWQEGSRHEWAWPCPDCGMYFIPRFKYLWWPEKATREEIGQQAALACPHCGILIHTHQKNDLNARGVYLAPGQSVSPEGEVIGQADTLPCDTASYWVSGVCSFSAKKTFGYLAKKYCSARDSGEDERLQSVMNTDFGELHGVGGEAPEWTEVSARQKNYDQGQVPEGVEVLTAGVDVQKNRLVYVVRGWGEHLESWLIEQGELWGETDKPEVWECLSRLVHQSWGERTLFHVAVDSGYQTQAVYSFCRLHRQIAFPTKGHDYLDKPFKKSNLDVNIQGKVVNQGLALWHFNADQMKCGVHARIGWSVEQPGGWWLPKDISDDYCKQMVSEQRVVHKSGKITWIKVKKDNHYFDAEVLAYLVIRMMMAGREQSTHILRPRRERRVIHRGFSSIEGGEVRTHESEEEAHHNHFRSSRIIHPGFDTGYKAEWER